MISNSITARERITPKDIMRIMGFKRKKAYQYYNKIRANKIRDAGRKGKATAPVTALPLT